MQMTEMILVATMLVLKRSNRMPLTIKTTLPLHCPAALAAGASSRRLETRMSFCRGSTGPPSHRCLQARQ